MFILNHLPFAYDSLEPFITKKTIEFHHDKHHQTYVNKLNELLEGHPDLLNLTLEELITNNQIPEALRQSVLNNAGQVYNHNIYWESIAPNTGGRPINELADKIDLTFGSFDKFKKEFTEKALGNFGSGWTWLSLNKSGELVIENTSNAISPLINGGIPLFNVDVWEHAYYLDYQNKRVDYINNIWNIINWIGVENKFNSI
jgi:Fe-Mn family superoxide dismutase